MGRRKPTVSNVRQKRRFLALITWYMDLKRASLAGRGFPRGSRFWKTGKIYMSDGQEKSPFSDSLAAEENGLGIENLNQRLQRYAGAKSRARYGELYQDWGGR